MSPIVYICMDPLEQSSAEARLRLGRHVHALRGRAGWRVHDLAARAGMSADRLQAVENGAADVDLSELATLANALDEPISALVAGEPPS